MKTHGMLLGFCLLLSLTASATVRYVALTQLRSRRALHVLGDGGDRTSRMRWMLP
ncbi:MAG: hypothetical protein V9H26_00135 [Verrucomicrobiota bacterium]